MTILYFIIAIGVLVLIHELGHFIVARRNNIRVEKFSIGFGPPIASIKRGETEYKIAPIPLGGYVKMTGEDPEDESTAEDERSFSNKSAWTRIRVTSAGPVMNIALAFILMPIVFLIGRMEPRYLKESPVVVGVQVSSPAERAGPTSGSQSTPWLPLFSLLWAIADLPLGLALLLGLTALLEGHRIDAPDLP